MSRQCPFCGALVTEDAVSCYHCRETLPELAGGRTRNPAAGYTEIRRGILYMVLAGVMHYVLEYLAGAELPFEIPTLITEYLTPFLFLGGLGLFMYGWILKLRG